MPLNPSPSIDWANTPSTTETERERIEHHFRLLVEWNEKINLVSRKSISLAFPQHVVDSLYVAEVVGRYPKINPIVDVGTGAGFPGIACAIKHPDRPFVLFEKMQKRRRFLEEVIAAVGLSNVHLEAAYEGKPNAGLFMARAVFPAAELFPFFRKLTREGSLLLTQLGGEQKHPEHIQGFRRLESFEHELPAGQGKRRIEVFARVPRGT